MTGVSIDHVASIVVLLAAVLLFMGLFNQTLTVAVDYQSNTSTAKACSDLLDTMLLTPGVPINGTPVAFGLQDSSLIQYQLNPFSVMRLNSSSGVPVYYQKTGMTYSTITTSPNNYLLYPDSDMINYSTAAMLLGINGTYGFQLSLTPTVNISIKEISTSPSLNLSLTVTGPGFPLANANVNYLLVPVFLNGVYPDFEASANQMGSVKTDSLGSVSIPLNFTLTPNLTYVFVAYAYLDGVTGVGYYEHSPVGNQSVVPFLGPLSTQTVYLANSADIFNNSTNASTLSYNTTFILENQNYAVQETSLGGSNPYGNDTSGSGNPPASISMGSYTPGILVIAYNNAGNNGVAMMPWGLSSLGFSMTFGGTPTNHGWVATDLRQVQINGISYQAKLSLWSEQGHSEVG